MRKKYFFFLYLFFVTAPTFSQIQLSENAEISIVTVGPGSILYEKFGHTAIRVKDDSIPIDLVYNYGIFDFEAPNFYANFTKGKLLYKLAKYPFHYFVASNKVDKRWIKSQTINLTTEKKQQFFTFLENNALPENCSYLYDPFFNNCATKPRDIVNTILKDKITLDTTYAASKKSFRELMNSRIHWNTWGSLGINTALGSKLDKIATANQYMYLPDFIYEGLKNATYYKENQIEKLIEKETIILNFNPIKPKSDTINPFLIFTIFLCIGLFISYKDIKNNTLTRWFDLILLLTTGLIGLLVIFLWFFTNHSTTPNNFNFLWAFAPNIIAAFLILQKNRKSWLKQYFLLLLLFLMVIPIIWILKIQQFAYCLIPLLVLLLIRCSLIYKSIKK